jgi:hypothetical protein
MESGLDSLADTLNCGFVFYRLTEHNFLWIKVKTSGLWLADYNLVVEQYLLAMDR